MITGECSYNCSEPPKEVQFEDDITAAGVLISYIATAGLVTTIATLHYLLTYQPILDPFRHNNGRAISNVYFWPNRVDMMILKAVRRKPKCLARVVRSDHWNWSRLDSAIIKYMLSMSDLQIATGIAILISGYAQLPCGLSCYHWQVVGRLAWFSSLTHLSCLTILRNYLYSRPAQRQWRLISMLVLIIMLVVAMVPTGTYEWAFTEFWSESSPDPSDYAICYFSQSPSVSTAAGISMSIFILLSTLGFLIRVVKLHENLSISLIGRPRKILSRYARNFLWKLYKQQKAQRLPQRIAGNICYFPALAFFLAVRVLLDHWSSMYFEVYWLLMSFLYGLLSLFVQVNVITSGVIIPHIVQSNYSNHWSFGQIMAVVLLAVPFTTTVELFYRDETDKPFPEENISSQSNAPLVHEDNTTPAQNLVVEIARPTNSFILDPDQDYYHHSTTLKDGNLLIIIIEFTAGLVTLIVTGGRDTVARFIAKTHNYYWPAVIIVAFCFLWVCILLSFLIDWTVAQKKTYCYKFRLSVMLQTLNVALCAFGIVTCAQAI